MAHEIDMSNDRANMAFVGEVPWHGLGYQLAEDASIEEWQIAAGMAFHIQDYPVMYYNPATMSTYPVSGRRVLVRDDTQDDLAVVSDSYKIVQPKEVLEFYRDIVSTAGFKLETAGVLKGGRKYWALARIGKEAQILKDDKIEGFLMLATSCDGTLATTAAFTSVRVVCNNTLQFAVEDIEQGRSRNYVKVPHNRAFDAEAVKAELGLAAQSWDKFIERSTALAKRKVSDKEAVEWLVKVFGDAEKSLEEQENARIMKQVHALFKGDGLGSSFESADGTAWGLVNAATEFLDHRRATRTRDTRLDRSWFGDGALLKQKAFDTALELVGA